MKHFLRAAAVAAILAAAPAAWAQTADRTYDMGPVWVISYVETKPGMFDDYMAYVGSTWRSIQETEKQAGNVLDYHVLAINDARDGEPDVILLTKLKGMATYDRPLAETDALMAKAFGSVKQGNVAAVKREDVRVLRGSVSAREMTFAK